MLLASVVDFSNGQIGLVLAGIQVVHQLLQRASGLQHELDLIEKMKTAVAFRNIVGERKSSTANLTNQPEFLFLRQSFATRYIAFRNSRAT